MSVQKYSKSMKVQIMVESGLVFSHLGGGLYEMIKNRYEPEKRLCSSEEVAELFNNTTKVAIEKENGDFLTNYVVHDRMKNKKTKRVILVNLT